MSRATPKAPSVIEQVRNAPGTAVKAAIVDLDGVIRGKYLSRDKFLSAVKPGSGGGFGFCDCVLGWDVNDQVYDNAHAVGWHHGFPDAKVRLDLSTFRTIPWENGMPFFLGEFVKAEGESETPHPLCPRQVLKRVLRRAEKLGVQPMCGMEFEWYNFAETPQSWAAKHFVQPQPLTPGMYGYSLLRMSLHREFVRALMEELPQFGIQLEGLHTETGPGAYEAAIAFGGALEAADRAVLFKNSAKEIGARFGIMPTFMAKWNPAYAGSSGHIHQSLSDGKTNLFYSAKSPRSMSPLFESYLAGQISCLMDFGPLMWPTINSYKRLVDGFWAPVKPTWGLDNRTASFRVIAGSPKSTRLETRCPGADVNPYLAMAAVIAAGLRGVEDKLKLTAEPITGANQGGENIPRSPRTLIETTRIFQRSAIARDWLGAEFVDHFAASREWEWRQWLDGVTDWEMKRYFEII